VARPPVAVAVHLVVAVRGEYRGKQPGLLCAGLVFSGRTGPADESGLASSNRDPRIERCSRPSHYRWPSLAVALAGRDRLGKGYRGVPWVALIAAEVPAAARAGVRASRPWTPPEPWSVLRRIGAVRAAAPPPARSLLWIALVVLRWTPRVAPAALAPHISGEPIRCGHNQLLADHTTTLQICDVPPARVEPSSF